MNTKPRRSSSLSPLIFVPLLWALYISGLRHEHIAVINPNYNSEVGLVAIRLQYYAMCKDQNAFYTEMNHKYRHVTWFPPFKMDDCRY